MLDERGSVTVTELKDLLDASESTVRRDITALGKAGRLIKVFGGAVAMEHIMTGSEPTVAQKVEVNKEEKCRIASYAAGLIEPEDFIFLDAGTTTGYMLDYLEEKNATFVTNAVVHAQKLAEMGMKVLLVGGELNKAVAAGHTDSPAEIAHPFRGIRAFICNLAVIDFNDAVSAGMDRTSCDAGHRDVTVVDADMGIVDSSNTGTDTEKIVGAIAFQMKVGIFDLITAVSFDKNAIK